MTDTQGNIKAEEKTASAIPTEDKPAESVEPKLPDGVAERTKEQFEKLTEHNAQLKAELDAYKSKTSVLDELKPAEVQVDIPNLTAMEVAEVKSKFVDEQGYVDVGKVEEALSQADARAKRAEERVMNIEKKIQNSEESAQVKAAHAKFPQLDPHSEQFDPKFYKLVKLNLVDQMMNGTQDLMTAAQEVTELYTPATQKEDAKAKEEHTEQVAKRDQASENVSSRGKGEPSDLEELKLKTQAGDVNAAYKRLQASGN